MFTNKTTKFTLSKSGILPAVFYPAAGLVGVIVFFTALFPVRANRLFTTANGWILETFGWFYVLVVSGVLIFAILLASSRFGAIRLGSDHERPDYSFASWFAMLFSAGMGIGLMFFAVAEPVMHYVSPPSAVINNAERVELAMELTFFHWGLQGWAIYAMVGLCLAYFSFRHKLPLTIRSALYPLIGNRIYGPIGHGVDILAVLGTLFGVATSLGFGVTQVNSGLNFLFGLPENVWVQISLIAIITTFATLSVVAGLDAGIKRLSELNLMLAFVLLTFVIILGPTVLIFSAFVENIGNYMGTLVNRSFKVGAYTDQSDWFGSWTIFYWAWWISWSPFVGMFIARISRGRTIREFILGVLFVPSILSFLWLTSYGNSALALLKETPAIASSVADAMPLALFIFLEQMPLSAVTSFLAVLLVITFFVTSSDSGSLVIDIITTGGQTRNPVWQRVFWAVTEGAVAAVLMLAGGLGALQTAAVATALPFSIVIILAIAGLMRALSLEAMKARGVDAVPDLAVGGVSVPWRTRLNAILSYPDLKKVTRYIEQTVRPALAEVAKEIKEHDSAAVATLDKEGAGLTLSHEGEPNFRFQVLPRRYLTPAFAFADTDPDEKEHGHFYWAEVFLAEGGQEYDVYGYDKSQVIDEVLNQYGRHMHFLHVSRGQ